MNKKFLFFLILILTSCVTIPKLAPDTAFDIPRGSRIGVINLVPKTMKHYHIGTTVFNNFEKECEVKWDIPGYLNDEVKRQAGELGYETVILEPDATLMSKLPTCTFKEGDKSVLNPDIIPLLTKLSDDFSIDLLLVFEPTTSTIFLPNIYVKVKGCGVGTRNFLLIKSATAFVMIDGRAISLKSLTVTQGATCLGQKDISGMDMIGNFRTLSEDYKDKIEDAMKGCIEKSVSRLMIKANLNKQVTANTGH